MIVAGSNCCKWNNCVGIEETLGEMGKDGTKVKDVKEGEISNTGGQATPWCGHPEFFLFDFF
jgi:hypothetical protein